MGEIEQQQAGHIAGLELVIKALMALFLASRVSDEAGFVKAGEEAARIRDRLLESVAKIREQANQKYPDSPMIATMYGAMEQAVTRCLDTPKAEMEQMAALLLELAQPPTSARN